MMLDDLLDASDYKETKASLQPKIEQLTRKLNGFNQVDGNYKGFIDEGFSFLRNLAEAFVNADLRAKQQFVGSVFPEKLIFENNQYRTPKMLMAFARILSIDGSFKRGKKKTEGIFVPQSALVIPLGSRFNRRI